MGARGPARTPLDVLKLRGSRLAKGREAEKGAPMKVKAPPCPAELGRVAKTEWRRLVRVLTAARTLTEGDRGVLAIAVEAWEEFIMAGAAIAEKCKPEKEGGMGPAGLEAAIAAGLTGRRDKAAARLLRALVQLGLTPASRSRVQAAPMTEEEDELDRFIREQSGVPNKGRFFKPSGIANRKRDMGTQPQDHEETQF